MSAASTHFPFRKLGPMELCYESFHDAACPGCGMGANDRDDPLIAVVSAMNHGDGSRAVIDALLAVAYRPDGTSRSCRWCRVFEGLDHADKCAVTIASGRSIYAE